MTETAATRTQQHPARAVQTYRSRFDETTPLETLRTSVYLGWIADCAWHHSTLVGFDRGWYTERGLTWLVRALRLDVLEPLPAYSEVTVSTEVLSFGRATARRRSEVRLRGELVALAEIDWLMINERGLPTRIPDVFTSFAVAEPGNLQVRRVALGEPPAGATERRIAVSRRDLDPLGHVNNGVYLDYLDDALEAAGQGELLRAVPRRYTLEYAAAATLGEGLLGRLWTDRDGASYLLAREGGPDLFRARVEG